MIKRKIINHSQPRWKRLVTSLIAVVLSLSAVGAVAALFTGNETPKTTNTPSASTSTATTVTAPTVVPQKEWSEAVFEEAAASYRSRCSYVDGNRLIVLGQQGRIFYSDDGENFISVENPGTSSTVWLDCIRVGDLYYIVSYENGIYSCSLQFEDWQLVLDAYRPQAIAYGDGQFLVVGDQLLVYSTDGINWKNILTTGYFNDVCYANGHFLFVDYNDLYTLDFGQYLSYKLLQNDITTATSIRHISYQNGFYYIAGDEGSLSVSRSADLQNWELVLSVSPGDANTYVRDICLLDGKLYLVGYNSAGVGFLYHSADSGLTWEELTPFDFVRLWAVAAYRNGLYIFGENRKIYIYK